MESHLYSEDHYADKISLDHTAENMYLIRQLINIRLERAKALLESGWGYAIQKAAQQVGYDDACHFSKLFKRRCGVPPSQMKAK